MKQAFGFLCAAVFAMALASAAGAAGIETDGLTATLDEGSGNLANVVVGGSLRLAECGLDIRSQAGRTIEPESIALSEADGRTIVVKRYAFGEARLTLGPGRHGLEWTYTYENKSPKQELVTLLVHGRLDPKGVAVYNGRETHKSVTGRKEVERRDKVGDNNARMPVIGAYNDRAGLLLGPGAADFHSLVVPEIVPNADGSITIQETVNMTLPPNGGTYAGRAHAIPFSPTYGERDALARYYACYPEIFRRRTDIDPRLHGMSASYMSWSFGDAELCRLTGADWEWCINPSRRNGDVADSHWDYEPARPFDKYRVRYFREGKWRQISFDVARDKWLYHQKQRLLNGKWCNVANGFYVICHSWFEEQMGKQYPDSLISKKGWGNTWLPTWGSPQDTAVAVFSYKTSWGDKVREMMKEVAARDVPISAFAFDSPGGNAPYRGPALDNIDNISWDKYGPYVARGVANAKLYEFVRTLQAPTGYRMGVLNNANHINNPLDAFYTDSTLTETNPWNNPPPWPLEYRYCMGEKSMSWWEGYHLQDILQVDRLTREDFEDAFRGLADFTALNSFRCGYTYQHYFSDGVEYLIRLMPAMKACNRAGFRPVTGFVVGDEKLTPARYGEGLDSFLTVGAWSREPVEARIVARPADLWTDVVGGEDSAAAPLVYADFFGLETQNAVAPDGVTIAARVLGRKVKVLECVMSLDDRARATLAVKQTKRYDRLTVTAKVDGRVASIDLPDARDHRVLESVSLDGKAVKFETATNANGVEVARVAAAVGGAATLEAVYRSTRTDLPEAELANVRYLDKDYKPLFKVRCGADENSRFLAERFVEFFRNYARYMRDIDRYAAFSLGVEIVEDENLPANCFVVSNNDAPADAFKPDMLKDLPFIGGDPARGVLALSGGSERGLKTVTYDLMNLLGATTYREYIGQRRRTNVRGMKMYLLPEEKEMFGLAK